MRYAEFSVEKYRCVFFIEIAENSKQSNISNDFDSVEKCVEKIITYIYSKFFETV